MTVSVITKEYGVHLATNAGNTHEINPNTTDTSQRTFTGSAENLANADQTIDLLNNVIGRQIGADNSTATINELAQKTIEHFRDVGLYTATINADGSVGISQTRISSEQAITAITSIRQSDNYGRTAAENEAAANKEKEQREQNQRRLPGKFQD